MQGGAEQGFINVSHVVEIRMSAVKRFSYKIQHTVAVTHGYNIKIYYHFISISSFLHLSKVFPVSNSLVLHIYISPNSHNATY